MNPKEKSSSRFPKTLEQEHECPLCGIACTTSWHEHTFVYGAEESATKLTVRLPVRFCAACDESFLDWEANEIEHRAVCEHLGVLSPAEIKEIRQKYGMTQKAFAEVSGIGETSISRLEKGLIIQSLENDRYLRLLQKATNLQELQSIVSRADSIYVE